MRKFNVGDIVINKDITSDGFGSYGKVIKLWMNEEKGYGVEYVDQHGVRKRFYEFRLKLKEVKVVQIYGLAKFCKEMYK